MPRRALIRPTPPGSVAGKVPPTITALFWVAKVLSTGTGEATSDWLHLDLSSLYVGAAIGVVALVVALALQFAMPRYVSWVYWSCVSVIAVVGTMGADGLHVILGVPYWASSAFFLLVLAAILAIWYRTEHTLSIHSITARRREGFYWLTVIATFALGTAVGDLTATTLGLGYLASGLLFTAAIALPLLAWRLLRLSPVLCFWWAYILTRPLGASFADWLAFERSAGGLGLGHGVVAAVGALLVLVTVAAMTARDGVDGRRRTTSEPATREAGVRK